MTFHSRLLSSRLVIAGMIALAIGGGAGLVSAHTGAMGVVKERMELMKDAGEATKALADMMRGKTAYEADDVRALAERIASHGGEAMTEKFPEGSLDPPTEARPEIWEDWSRFEELADQMKRYALALAEAADNPRAGGGQSGGMMSQGSSMMSQGGGMMSQGGGMMGQQGGPTAEQLAAAPPDMAFRHLTQTCSACHKSFRVDK